VTPSEWAIVIPAIAAVSRIAAALEKLVKAKLEARQSGRPASSASGDKMKAVVADFERERTANKVNELHDALGQKDPLTRGYVIPEHLRRQTAALDAIREELPKQTEALREIAKKPGSRY
jgi:hypothetical protein